MHRAIALMNALKTQIQTDEWVTATWEQFKEIASDPAYEKAKCYYDNGQLRIEVSIGSSHSRDNTVVILAVNLFCGLKGIPLNGLTNCSYRKEGVRECQPDVSYYIGDHAQLAPDETSVVDLNSTPAPDLMIEIGDSSLADDLGRKRLMYEQLNIAEYWVVDVQGEQVIAFAVADGGSRRIQESQVLPGLKISLLEEALQRSRQTDQSQVVAWLLAQFQDK